MKNIIELGKFLASLSTRGIIILLLSIIIGASGYRIRTLEEEIKIKDVRDVDNNTRHSNIVGNLERQIEACNQERLREANESQKYWREKFDKMEEKSLQTFKKVKEIK